MVIYTAATVAFYLLGAAVLNAQGMSVDNTDLVPTLSNMYTESFGAIGLWVFLIGAFLVLYSTVFIATASNTRLSVDALQMFGAIKLDDETGRRRWIQIAAIALPALYFLAFVSIGSPVSLVLVGAFAQALMLPLLAVAALYHLYRHTIADLLPSPVFRFFLWISALLIMVTGVYQLLKVAGLV
jgi:Mn2+/Fe2+ NRAMP family transporter